MEWMLLYPSDALADMVGLNPMAREYLLSVSTKSDKQF
jgi:hypothetical protein